MTYKKQIIKEMQNLLAQLDKAENTEPEFKVGDRVYHDDFGLVDILNIDSDGRIWLDNGAWCELADLTKTESPEPEPEINWNVRPKFKLGENCWFITPNGSGKKYSINSYSSDDLKNNICGLLYRTEAELNWYREQRKLIVEMEDYIGFDDLDWNDSDQTKYYYILEFEDKKWINRYTYSYQLRGKFPPCPSEEKAKETYDQFKDRLDYLKPYDGRNE